MDKTARFWNAIANRYSKQAIADQATYEKKLAKTQAYLRPDMRVLEFGCGTGSTALIHASFVKHIHAIDYSEKMIEIAVGKATAAGVNNLHFECSNIMVIDETEHQYDAVIGLNVIHLLEDWQGVISKVHRLLKPGGLFASSTPCLSGALKIFKIFKPVSKLTGFLPMLATFSENELTQCIKDTGFRVDDQWVLGKTKGVFVIATKI